MKNPNDRCARDACRQRRDSHADSAHAFVEPVPQVAPQSCRCGSGAHPRRCAVHSERYAQHCDELSTENAPQSESGSNASVDPMYVAGYRAGRAEQRERDERILLYVCMKIGIANEVYRQIADAIAKEG